MGTTLELDVDAAVAALLAAYPAPSLATTRVERHAARLRVLADAVCSTIDLPAFDNAAMDGYALRAADTAPNTPLPIIGRALAGHAFDGVVATGTCVRVTTGAPLPRGADTVVMQEDVRVTGDAITLATTPSAGTHVRRRGEHIAAGDVVLAAGRQLQAEDLGLLASIGVITVAVRAPLVVAVASTGDELRDAPAALAPGTGYDANRPFLAALVDAAGHRSVDLGICADHAQAFDALIERACDAGAHVLLTTGGAALGDADVVRRSGVQFLPINIRPGRGIAHARLERRGHSVRLLGLPGNAVAAFVMHALVASRVLLAWAGVAPRPRPVMRAPLAAAVSHRPGRIDWMRARWVHGHGESRLQPLPQQGSAMLRTVVDADALIGIGPQADYAAGEMVELLPLPRA